MRGIELDAGGLARHLVRPLDDAEGDGGIGPAAAQQLVALRLHLELEFVLDDVVVVFAVVTVLVFVVRFAHRLLKLLYKRSERVE